MNKIFNQHPHHENVIKSFLKHKNPNKVKQDCKLETGIPCKPMLAKPTKEIGLIFKRFEKISFTCEYKYDGFRGQIHYNGKDFFIFSRNLENMTDIYPDVILSLKQSLKNTTQNIIIDAELVPFDKQNNKILPFHVLTKRSKKNVTIENIECNVCIYCFDILYFNNENLLEYTLTDRRKKLNEALNFKEGSCVMTNYKDLNNIEDIENYLDDSIKDGCEGLMVKTLLENSSYEPCLRTFKWLKLKKDYLNNGIGDSFDLVPIGAKFGEGNRKNTYGTYLLACYNVEYDRYEPCTMVGTGFSEENLKELTKIYKEREIKEPLQNFYNVSKIKDVDIWFDPIEVWEIKAADLQISPKYFCANQYTKEQGNGIGLRFPRFIKKREDKKIMDSTQPKFIFEIYNSQALINGEMEFEDDDY